MGERVNKTYPQILQSDFPNNAIPCFVSSSGAIYTPYKKRNMIASSQGITVSHNHIVIVSDTSVVQGKAT